MYKFIIICTRMNAGAKETIMFQVGNAYIRTGVYKIIKNTYLFTLRCFQSENFQWDYLK